MLGRFWAVGVGPGDPGLITVKAADVLRSAGSIYHAGPEDTKGRALDVVREILRPEQMVHALLQVSMAEASASEREAYRPGVERIAADCRRGVDVAYITEGDPTLYSTAAHVWGLLAELHPDIPANIVPGVSSITAAAARVAWPLAQRDETLCVFPASHHAAQLHAYLQSDRNICFLKPSSALPALVDAINKQGPECEAVYIEELGTAKEWLTHDLAQAIGRDKYFSLVLLRRTPKPRRPQPFRAKVWVVGLGPGDPALLTRQALCVLHGADDLVGYEAYLKRLEPIGLRGVFHGLPIGAEAERARLALELARQGRQVALVSSGDPGVYGMASLFLEAAQVEPNVDIEVIPGVTAATAAAALLGAPLGHDFACISLSDLLTPWPIIEKRLEAAGKGDFVVALYNPASRERTWQLARARDILLRHRPGATPVGLVTGAYRARASVHQTTLEKLTADGVTMETTVVIGSSTTRSIDGRLVTPRGYCTLSVEDSAPDSERAEAGRRIQEESFAIIRRELEPHPFPDWAFAVVVRIIHASADFDFAQALRYSPDFEAAIRNAFQEQGAIVTDTEMVLHGLRAGGANRLTFACHLNDPAVPALAQAAGLTRTAAGIRQAARAYARPILVIGNAPTALEEALRLVEQEGWRPAALIGIPVGFVGVEEAKRHLQGQAGVPYLTCVGRKGGSAITAAAVNALVEYFHAPSRSQNRSGPYRCPPRHQGST
jgi:precorrin-2 C(20)-methyltransferase